MINTRMNQWQGISALVGAAVVYGTVGILSRYVGFELPLFYQNWTRNLIPVVLLIATYKQWKVINKKDYRWILLRTVFGIAAFLLFFLAVNNLQVGLTYFIFYGGATTSGFIIGSLFFKERTTKIRLISLGLALVGLALVYNSDISTNGPFFMFLSFLSGICFALWNMVAKRMDSYSAAQLTFVDNGLSALILMGVSLAVQEPWPAIQATTAHISSLLIGVTFFITGTLTIYGFRKIDVQIGSLILLSEILFATFFSYMFFREVPAPLAGFGGLLIIAAMALPEISWGKLFKKHYANRRKIA